MGKSRRRTPIVGVTTARSEKDDKRIVNRAIRRKSRVLVYKEDAIFPIPNEVLDKWSMAKDGKVFIGKNSIYYKKALRK